MRKPRQRESGFALLMVFVMAAGIALFLYAQLPRTAFESMRAKEETLVERGEQYQRALQLYVNKFQRYPSSIDDLEKTNNIRFLRKRFKDPFTGKDDWRMVHVDNQGRLTDSLVPQKKEDEKKANTNTFITENAGLGQSPTDLGQEGTNVALRRRPSEGGTPEGGAAPLPAPSGFTYAPFGQPAPQQQPVPNPLTGNTPGQTGQPGATGPSGQQIGSAIPINPNTGQPIIDPQKLYPNGVPQFPGQAAQQQQQQGFGQQGQQPTFPIGVAGTVGRPGVGGPGNTPQNVLDMINQALRSPSPNIPMNLAPGMQIQGGIAGFASKHDSASIKLYNEQKNYKKWEFIYDPRKDKRLQGALQRAGAQQPQNNIGNPMGNPIGGNSPSPFGQPSPQPGGQPGGQPGFGQPGGQPGFGQPGGQSGGFGQPGFGQPPQMPGFPGRR